MSAGAPEVRPRADVLRPGVRPRELWGWAMFDFANSGFTTVVITALFNAYFVAVLAGGAPWATFAWTAALAVSHALVVISGPVMGAWADRHGAKKRLLALTTAGCVLSTALLALAGPEALWWAVACLVAATFFFGVGENLIAAFLPEIARPRALGRVSGWGWGLGYLGGLSTLGLCLAYIAWAEARGLGPPHYVPASLLITASLFALASLPTFLWLRERAAPAGAAASAWGRVGETLRHLRRFPDLSRFLWCSLFYQAGIQTVIALAAVYATQALGFTPRQALELVLLVNVTAAVGAFLFGHLQDLLGHVRAIALILVFWIATVALAWAAPAYPGVPALFWLAANLAGLGLGGAQSAGRALMGVLSPPARRAEFYGFWGLAVKLAAIAGPLSYGLVTWMSGGDHRRALLLTGAYFVAGLVLLTGVNAARGRRAALRANTQARETGSPPLYGRSPCKASPP